MSNDLRQFQIFGFDFSVFDSDTIADAQSLSSLSTLLNLGNVPLPEMIYARNFLSIKHEESGLNISFTATGALKAWNTRQIRTLGEDAISVEKYDWTYSCDYNGDCNLDASSGKNSELGLPMERLTRRGPILFFATFPLFASDLNDRGLSECTIKLRVMEDCFLVLIRSFVRVDRERVYLRDVRYCHVFKEGNTSSSSSRSSSAPITRTLNFDDQCLHGAPAPGSSPDIALAISQFVTKIKAIPPSEFMQLLELMVEFEKAQTTIARSSHGILILRAASIDAFVKGKYDHARSCLSSALFFEASSMSDHFVSQLFKETPDKSDKGYLYYTSKLDILQNIDTMLEELRYRRSCKCLQPSIPIILRDLQLRTAVLPDVIERNSSEDNELLKINSGQLPSFFTNSTSPLSPLGKNSTVEGMDTISSSPTVPMIGSAISPPSFLSYSSSALSPQSQRTVHPIVLESIRERASRSGGSPKMTDNIISQEFTPTDVAARFLSADDVKKLRGSMSTSPMSSSSFGTSRSLPNKLDITAEDVYESIACEVTELLELVT